MNQICIVYFVIILSRNVGFMPFASFFAVVEIVAGKDWVVLDYFLFLQLKINESTSDIFVKGKNKTLA